jgi:hypothetical protein
MKIDSPLSRFALLSLAKWVRLSKETQVPNTPVFMEFKFVHDVNKHHGQHFACASCSPMMIALIV